MCPQAGPPVGKDPQSIAPQKMRGKIKKNDHFCGVPVSEMSFLRSVDPCWDREGDGL